MWLLLLVAGAITRLVGVSLNVFAEVFFLTDVLCALPMSSTVVPISFVFICCSFH